MRASTLFALTLALLIGLGVAVAGRWLGWFGRPPMPVPPKKEIQILVAARNVFPGDLIDPTWVKTRALKTEEEQHYEANKQKYLPPVPQAAVLRVANKNIEADSPILRDDLKEMSKPEPLHERLLPNMRALNVSVLKDHSAGGLIQVGEWVDVLFTSTIWSDQTEPITRTAAVAHRLRVIAKRNALWNVFAALPDDKPVHFTLEANPYRSGLIEFCKSRGDLSLVPVSASEQRTLEDKRSRLLTLAPEQLQPVLFQDTQLSDYEQEESRIEAFNRGTYSVGNADLVRIFDLKTPPPPTAEVKVEQFSGLQRAGTSRFGPDGTLLAKVDERKRRQGPNAANTTINGFRFKCEDCEKRKKKAALGN